MCKKTAIALVSVFLCFSFLACGEGGRSDSPSMPEIPNTPGLPDVPDIPAKEDNLLQIKVGSSVFTLSLYKNEAVKQFVKLLPITLEMDELNGNEKYFYLPQNLPTDSQNVGKINAGDLMLYGSNCLVLFYKSFSTNYRYTKLGKAESMTGLLEALGRDAVTVTFNSKP